jgi:hypothetical protein
MIQSLRDRGKGLPGIALATAAVGQSDPFQNWFYPVRFNWIGWIGMLFLSTLTAAIYE